MSPLSIRLVDPVGFNRTITVKPTDLAIKNRKAPGDRLEDGLLPVSATHREAILDFAKEHASEELFLILTLGFFTGIRLGTLADLKIQTLERAAPDPASPDLYRLAVGPGADGPANKRSRKLSRDNADLLRQITAWWLFGPRAVCETATLFNKHNQLFPLFNLCSMEGISASNLSRYPMVADKLPKTLAPSTAGDVFSRLHMLFEHREMLGFVLLDRDGLSRLEAALPDYEKGQTPYIPPRIWTYQLSRLRAFLDDFLAQPPCVEALFDRAKAPAIRLLGRVIASRLIEAPEESPYRESLEAQQRAVENALNVIDT